VAAFAKNAGKHPVAGRFTRVLANAAPAELRTVI